MESKFSSQYYEHFKTFIPSYKKQYFRAKLQGDIDDIIAIKDNVWRNWNLTVEQKRKIIKEIGITE